MSVRVDTDWSYRGVQAVTVENEQLRLVLLPDLGGKPWSLVDKRCAFELLWHHPRLRPRPVPFGAGYDDVFFGGWDELFPNDVPEELAGEQLPDHGEVWSLPWQWRLAEVSDELVTVHLWVETPISACRLDKWVTVRAGEACVRFKHRIVNQGGASLPFMWKLHTAVALAEHSRLELPASTVRIGDWGEPRNGETGVTYEWPHLGGHDMRATLPASAGVSELQYATDLTAGWCAVRHPSLGTGLGLAFDTGVLDCCWTFASYGGWRDLRVAVLEPCTGYPLSVNEGVAQGTHRVLPAGEVIECDVTAVVLDGTELADVSLDGRVR